MRYHSVGPVLVLAPLALPRPPEVVTWERVRKEQDVWHGRANRAKRPGTIGSTCSVPSIPTRPHLRRHVAK
uniref:Putative secreted peptide n=1 Tax=Anopheles braziliensis TaxID=58242 RepID=A0A2M3ZVC7_9DIPT